MVYTKVKCYIEPDSEAGREILVARLMAVGFEGFHEQDSCVEAFIPTHNFNCELLSEAAANISLFSARFVPEEVPDKNWNKEWESNYYKPVLIDNKCLIRAPFHCDYPKAKYEIVIEPKMAFGTGYHETTSLVISYILVQDVSEKHVLDMGCGTGILGILASMQGAVKVTSIDIDKWAFSNTVENADINGIKNLSAYLGGAELLKGREYDIIYANIHRNALLNDMEMYVSTMRQGGEIVMSGFYMGDMDLIRGRAEELNLSFISNMERNNWAAVRFVLNG